MSPLWWAVPAVVVTLLLGVLAWRWRRRAREHQRLSAQGDAQLKLSLWASGDELWSVDLDSGALTRQNQIPDLRVNQEASAQTLDGYLPFVHPEDVTPFRAALRSYVEGKSEMLEVVYRSPARDGSWRWLQSRGRVVERHPDGHPRRISGITSDVSLIKDGEAVVRMLNTELTAHVAELEAAQAAVRAGDEKLLLALWGSDSEYWEADLVSQTVRRFAPLKHLHRTVDAEAVEIHSFHRFVHPDDLETVLDAAVAHLKQLTESFDVIFRARRSDGRWAWLRTRGRVSQRGADGRAMRMIGITFDVTRIKRSEEDLRELNEQLEARVAIRTAELAQSNVQLSGALEELRRTQGQLVEQEKLAALGGLVAGIAHEINTPLGIGVTAASHLHEQAQKLKLAMSGGALKRSMLDEFADTAVQSSELVLVNLNRASALVRSFKQVAVDQASDERRVIDLKAYLQEILLSLQPTLKKVPHQIRLECAEAIGWDTCPGALYQVLVNLLMNALLHAWPDARTGTFRIVGRRAGPRVLLEFADDGCGMSEEVRRRAFDPFFTTRRGQGGSGLGLHIVYNLVTQRLRGSIEVQSSPDAGTRFLLDLPHAPG